jgi:uncharacterized protein (DUF1499 family)
VTRVRPLRPCGSGSCVSTQTSGTDPLRRIEPLGFATPREVALRAVLRVLARQSRVRILERDDVSVHAVVRSAVLRVPLDLDVVIDEAGGRIHLRASTPFALRERSLSRTRAEALLRAIERELRRPD